MQNETPDTIYYRFKALYKSHSVVNDPEAARELLRLRGVMKTSLGLPLSLRMPDKSLMDAFRRNVNFQEQIVYPDSSKINIDVKVMDINALQKILGEEYEDLFEI